MLSLLDGDLEPAEGRVTEAMAYGERLESPEVALEVGGQLAYLRLEQGRAGEIVDAARSQLARGPGITVWRAALAVLLVAADGRSEARRELERLARQRFEDVPRDRGYLPTLAMAAGVASALGDARAGSWIASRLAPYARLHVVAGSGLLYYGAVSHALGHAAMACERGDEAFEHFEAALASEEALGARLWAARARVDCARALLARGGAPARAHAAKLLEEALGAARSGGWAEVTRAGRELEAALWTGRGSAARGPRARRRPSES
jgi:hypothetical protein